MVRSGEVAGRAAERTSFGWAALVAALAMSVGPNAAAQSPPSPVSPTPQAAPGASLPVLLEADQLIDDDAAKTITARGAVEIRYGGRTMRADTVVYNLTLGTIHATGDVEIVTEDG